MSSKKDTDLFRLDERVAIITGAAGHLGRSMARALCEAGSHVILNGRSIKRLEKFAAELRYEGYEVSVSAFDISHDDQLKRALEDIANTHSRLDIIVNNAYAYANKRGRLKTINVSDFEHSFNVSVTAAFRIIQLAQPLLEKSALQNIGGASVINIASMYGMVSSDPNIYGDSGFDDPPYYGAAKAALIQLTRYTACRLAPLGIRVNCISPGPFPHQNIKEGHPSLYAELCRRSPMKRIGSADELKGPLTFLASDAASYVTGINLAIDGGWTAW